MGCLFTKTKIVEQRYNDKNRISDNNNPFLNTYFVYHLKQFSKENPCYSSYNNSNNKTDTVSQQSNSCT